MRHEVVPGRQVADERLRVDAAELFLTDRERDDGNVGRLEALIRELLVERHVRVAVDGRNHRGRRAGRELLHLGDDRLVVGVAERRVLLENVRRRSRPCSSGSSGGSCWSCAGRRSRCRAAPTSSRRRPFRSSGTRRRESPADSARRPCRTRCRTTLRLRIEQGRRAARSALRTRASTDFRDTEVQQPKVTATLSFWISSRAFSAKSGQFEAGSTTTGSSLPPSTPPALLRFSIVMSATSLRDVSLMAIVPDKECRMPTLIGPVSLALAVGAGRLRGPPSQKPLRREQRVRLRSPGTPRATAPNMETVTFNQVFISFLLPPGSRDRRFATPTTTRRLSRTPTRATRALSPEQRFRRGSRVRAFGTSGRS